MAYTYRTRQGTDRAKTTHSVRVEDRIWEKAQRVAFQNHTTVSAIIVGYLGSLTIRSKLKPSQIHLGPIREKPLVPSSKGQKMAKPVKVSQADCSHPEDKRADFGWAIFCRICGKRMPGE
ncbi:MAG: hypothetical protein OK454_00020 [Thaumarchaeota archaeon]|nr:hypothetical protein [Nitrososphaerota archaeon]